MEKISKFIKDKKYILLVIFFVAMFLNHCSVSRKLNQISTINEQYKIINTNFQIIDGKLITQEELEIMYEIRMYEFLKLQLDDNNKIVRTVVRPDDKIREYDDNIKKLQEKLNSIRK